MSIKKLDDGRYMVDIRPRGAAGRRIRKTFDRKAEATAFEQYTIANASQKEWAGKRADRRPLSELLDAWWRYHGQNHENGKKEFNHLLKTISGLGDPAVSRLSKRDLMDYRSSRLNAGMSSFCACFYSTACCNITPDSTRSLTRYNSAGRNPAPSMRSPKKSVVTGSAV